MESGDNVIKAAFGEGDTQEKGRCFILMKGAHQAMMLEVRIFIPDGKKGVRHDVWQREFIPYAEIKRGRLIPSVGKADEDMIITLYDDTIITVSGDNLTRLADALPEHKLRMVRPLRSGESRTEDEPRIIAITIEDAEE